MSCTPSSSAGGGGGAVGGGGGGAVGGAAGSGGTAGPCGACKFLRRKCVTGCIFAPYFDSEQGAAQFAAVHKVFGASNVSKLLLHIPAHKRLDAVITICYEAQARLRDPVYGCVAHIFALQQQVVNLQAELSYLQAHLAAMELPAPPVPPPPSLQPSNWPIQQQQPQQHHQHHQNQHQQRQIGGAGGSFGGGGSSSGDLQALAMELLDRHRSAGGGHEHRIKK